jgi:hypothetical protein
MSLLDSIRMDVVEKVNRAEMSNIFEDWEKTHQDELRKLMALIKAIREVARLADDRE